MQQNLPQRTPPPRLARIARQITDHCEAWLGWQCRPQVGSTWRLGRWRFDWIVTYGNDRRRASMPPGYAVETPSLRSGMTLPPLLRHIGSLEALIALAVPHVLIVPRCCWDGVDNLPARPVEAEKADTFHKIKLRANTFGNSPAIR